METQSLIIIIQWLYIVIERFNDDTQNSEHPYRTTEYDSRWPYNDIESLNKGIQSAEYGSSINESWYPVFEQLSTIWYDDSIVDNDTQWFDVAIASLTSWPWPVQISSMAP